MLHGSGSADPVSVSRAPAREQGGAMPIYTAVVNDVPVMTFEEEGTALEALIKAETKGDRLQLMLASVFEDGDVLDVRDAMPDEEQAQRLAVETAEAASKREGWEADFDPKQIVCFLYAVYEREGDKAVHRRH